ncbi:MULTISPECIES: hypothetical protein [Neobacillus]|uniref:Uncharacterized protein n=1 Tax=Neobacillus rhizophilus TaxID=2833579 RepID=A0A942U1X5_9BACI|nr:MULTISPECIES: hypothetical protein [Neobacillus]MBS4211297.1 hypothetical protein [Neobacillus rhizophilus]MBU8918819.1 hypothetical protein [Bacillus sp. FJAT-29953]
MKKKWFYTVALAGLIAIPLSGFSSDAKSKMKIMPNQITLESGGTSVPYSLIPNFPSFYHQPMDGIISGALGCVPDKHEFNKSTPGEHIVFTAGIGEFSTEEQALALNDDFTIYVEITSNGQRVLELPFEYHRAPDGTTVDPNTKKPFWVSALYFKSIKEGPIERKGIDLPTGEYNYKFKVKVNGKNGHILDVWVPKNHKFTIIDATDTN